MRLKTWMAAIVLLSAAAQGMAAAPTRPQLREVLPSGVVPRHYDLLVSPDAEATAFQGKLGIDIDVQTASNQVVLNAADLVFDQVTLDGNKSATVSIDNKLQRATLSFGTTVTRGRHHLAIAYHGPISRSTLGFFAMEYATPDGPRRILATNFEPAAARRLLPCWDEPGRKASFTVAIDAPTDHMAFSNMPVSHTESLSATMQRVHFAPTPKMSTYLLFLGTGDFERISQKVDGVDVGVVVKRGDTAKAAYALQEAVALLHFYNDYFGIAYPLPKLDLIAAPGNIQGVAMENWGAIFYSQETLLFDPAASTEAERQDVFLTVSHEMAHQWFGDLVTMAWWDDLWLNEGFARWMQTHAADALHPEWETGLRAAAIFESGRAQDAAPSTHPVVQQVFTAEQAAQSFDGITYDKGAAVITMLHDFIGADKFRGGVRDYMRAHAYGNTVDTDFWRLMQKNAGADIVAIERDFTRQEGVPLVRVTTDAGRIHLQQGRFAIDPATIAGARAQAWRLPLSVQTLGQPPQRILMRTRASLPVSAPLLVNAGQTGYARVLYDRATREALSTHMAQLAPVDQLGLINDSLALGVAGYAPASDVMRLIAGVAGDANPIVWQRVIMVLKSIDQHYAGTPQRAAFRRHALAVLAPLAQRIGPAAVAGETSNMGVLRDEVILAQGRFGEAAVIASARDTMAHGGSATGQRGALAIAAAHSDAAGFDTLLAGAAATADPLARMRILQALAGVEDGALAARMVDVALGPLAPAGSAPQLLTALASNHPDLVWTALASRLEDPKLPMETSTRWQLAIEVASYSSSPERIAHLDAYQARNVPQNARKPFLGAAASIRSNQRFERTVLPEIDRWIAAQ
jgi:aminopeptidase N